MPIASACGREGTILVGLAVFLFVLLPILALVLHTGLITLTRRQMQTAAHSAALEGLRHRDAVAVTWTDSANHPAGMWDACGEPPDQEAEPEAYAAWLECARRWSSGRHVQMVFDGDLHAGTESSVRLGAGPDVQFQETDGIAVPGTQFIASRKIVGVAPFRPHLEPNTIDDPHGDQLSGQYLPGTSHTEDADYVRDDFADPADPRYETSQTADAYLVRLRRTQPSGQPAPGLDAVAGVNSTGPTVPFLFGLGANTRAVQDSSAADPDNPDPAALWNRRQRGTIVRATAIAQARPAVTVGVPSSDVDRGLARFWIEANGWERLSAGDTAEVILDPDAGSFSGPGLDGVAETSDDIHGQFILREVVTLGDALDTLESLPEDIDLESGLERIVALYETLGTENRIVGFGRVRLETTSDPDVVQVHRLPPAVEPINASATFAKPVDPDFFDDAWAQFKELSVSVLAPARVRSID
ncbi:Tad domain-containing protein [Maioricimonas rarisocia]|uniref:Tad domain-containing protein n=1 Tax=Maioricimonas rarisocia TaxID=2528026 RepID=UPI0018D2232D|nr:Tad domain-containing protein [Maioricimonas rarisocia]